MRKHLSVLGMIVLTINLIPALSKELCFKDGWVLFGLGFKNQGECIGYIHDQLL